VATFQKYLAAQKLNIGANFGQFLNVIANISGIEQKIVEGKMALQTAISPALVRPILNLVNFGPQMATNRTGDSRDPTALQRKDKRYMYIFVYVPQSYGALLAIWDHSVTCHPTQVKAPRLTPRGVARNLFWGV